MADDLDKIGNQVAETLKKPASRKEFIGYLGLAFLSLIGVSSLMKKFTKVRKGGFGSSKYGGDS